MKLNVLAAALVAALPLTITNHAPAATQDAPAQKAKQSQPIYGYQMMTDAERNEYRDKMRSSKTAQERETLRNEHRATMEARMKERGIEPGEMRGKGGGPGGPGYGKGGGPGGPGYGKGGGPGGPGVGAGGPGPGYGQGAGPGGPGKGYGKGPGPGGPGKGYGPGTGPAPQGDAAPPK